MKTLPRLGKKAARYDPRNLRLDKYLSLALPAPPPAVDHTLGIIDWGMMGNDSLGDCTIADCGHAVQVWTANAGREVTVPDAAVIQYYEEWDGYVAGDPSTDNGGNMLDVNNQWRKKGFAGHTLLGFVSINPRNLTHVRQAIQLFGGVSIGIQLPVSAQSQNMWDVVQDDGGVWGGHAIYAPKYDSVAKTITCISWGQLISMTEAFFLRYVDELYALLSNDWLKAHYLGQNNLDLVNLIKDITAVAA